MKKYTAYSAKGDVSFYEDGTPYDTYGFAGAVCIYEITAFDVEEHMAYHGENAPLLLNGQCKLFDIGYWYKASKNGAIFYASPSMYERRMNSLPRVAAPVIETEVEDQMISVARLREMLKSLIAQQEIHATTAAYVLDSVRKLPVTVGVRKSKELHHMEPLLEEIE